MSKPSRKEVRQAKANFLKLLEAQVKLAPEYIEFVYSDAGLLRSPLYKYDRRILVPLKGKCFRIYARTVIPFTTIPLFLVVAGRSKQETTSALEELTNKNAAIPSRLKGTILRLGLLDSLRVLKLIERNVGDPSEELKKWFSLE